MAGTLSDQNAASLGIQPLEAELHAFQPKTVQIILTDQQIKELPTTSIELVSAPGAGKVIVPLLATAVIDTTAGAYTNVSSSGNDILVLLNGGNTQITSGIANNGLFPDPAFNVAVMPGKGWYDFVSAVDNLPIYIGCTNSAGDFEDGHPDNTLKLVIQYFVLDVSS